MKINKFIISHWILLAKTLLIASIASIIRPFLKKDNIVLMYGHKLNGNLHAIYTRGISNSNTKIFFVSMDEKYIHKLKSDKIHTLNCTKLVNIFIIASAKVIISDHGLHSLILLKYFSNIKFIDVWHGIPYKGFDSNDFSLQLTYDEIWVASPFHKNLYIEKYRFDPKKVFVTGYARTDILINREDNSKELQIKYNIPTHKKIIAFCPTWKQDDKYRNIFPFDMEENEFLKKLNEFCQDKNVAFLIRKHLNTDNRRLAHYKNLFFLDADNYPLTEEILLISDILICDWSSISFDYILLKRPTLFLDVPIPFKKGLSISATYRYGDIADSITCMLDFLNDYIHNDNAFYERNLSKIEDVTEIIYGKNIDGKSTDRCLERLLKLMD